MAGILFENIFDIREIDRDGKKFDKGNLRSSGDERRLIMLEQFRE